MKGACRTPWNVAVVLQSNASDNYRLVSSECPAAQEGENALAPLQVNKDVVALGVNPVVVDKVTATVQQLKDAAGVTVEPFRIDSALLSALDSEMDGGPQESGEKAPQSDAPFSKRDEASYVYIDEMEQRISRLFNGCVAPAIDRTVPIDPSMPPVSSTVLIHGASGSTREHVVIGTPSLLGILPRAITSVMDRVQTGVQQSELVEEPSNSRRGSTGKTATERASFSSSKVDSNSVEPGAESASARGGKKKYGLVEASFIAVSSDSVLDLLNLENEGASLRLSTVQHQMTSPRVNGAMSPTIQTKVCAVNGCSVMTVSDADTALEVLDIGLTNLTEAERTGCIHSEHAVALMFIIRVYSLTGVTSTFQFCCLGEDAKVSAWLSSTVAVHARDPAPSTVRRTLQLDGAASSNRSSSNASENQNSEREACKNQSSTSTGEEDETSLAALAESVRSTPPPQLIRHQAVLLLLPLVCHGNAVVSFISCVDNGIIAEEVVKSTIHLDNSSVIGRRRVEVELLADKFCASLTLPLTACKMWTLPISTDVSSVPDSPLRRNKRSSSGFGFGSPSMANDSSLVESPGRRDFSIESPSGKNPVTEVARDEANAPETATPLEDGVVTNKESPPRVLLPGLDAVANLTSVLAKEGRGSAAGGGADSPRRTSSHGVPAATLVGDSPSPKKPLYPLDGDRDFEAHHDVAQRAVLNRRDVQQQTQGQDGAAVEETSSECGPNAPFVVYTEPPSVSPMTVTASVEPRKNVDDYMEGSPILFQDPRAYPSSGAAASLPIRILSAAVDSVEEKKYPLTDANTSAVSRLYTQLRCELAELHAANEEMSQHCQENSDIDALTETFTEYFRKAYKMEKRVHFLELDSARTREEYETERKALRAQVDSLQEELYNQHAIQSDLEHNLTLAQQRIAQLEDGDRRIRSCSTPTSARTPRRIITPRSISSAHPSRSATSLQHDGDVKRNTETSKLLDSVSADDDDDGDVAATPNAIRLLRQLLRHMGETVHEKGSRALLKHVDSVLATSMESPADSSTTMYLIHLLWDMTVDYSRQADNTMRDIARENEEKLARIKAVYTDRFRTTAEQMKERQETLLKRAHADYEAAIQKERQRTEALLGEVQKLKKMWMSSISESNAQQPQSPEGSWAAAPQNEDPTQVREARTASQKDLLAEEARPQSNGPVEWVPPPNYYRGGPQGVDRMHGGVNATHGEVSSRAKVRSASRKASATTPMRLHPTSPDPSRTAHRTSTPKSPFTNPPSILNRMRDRQSNARKVTNSTTDPSTASAATAPNIIPESADVYRQHPHMHQQQY